MGKWQQNNPECNQATPDLEESYLSSIEGLKEKSLVMEIDGESVYINDQDGIYFMRRLLYGTNSRTMIPSLIKEYLNGGGPIIRNLIVNEYKSNYNYAMWLAVERYEMYNSQNSEKVINEVYESLHLLPSRLGLFDAVYRSLGKIHGSEIVDDEKSFQMSDIPTLITVNQFDPVTPPENGHIIMKTLAQGQLFILDEGGHGGGDAECRNKVMIDFIKNPTANLDVSCLNIFKGDTLSIVN